MLALLFEPLVARINNFGLFSVLLYGILAGATPIAAFPGIYLFGGKATDQESSKESAYSPKAITNLAYPLGASVPTACSAWSDAHLAEAASA